MQLNTAGSMKQLFNIKLNIQYKIISVEDFFFCYKFL